MGKKKYSTEEKLNAVKSVLENRASGIEAAQTLGAHKGDVQKWIAVYEQHGIAGLERLRIGYTGRFKIMVIEDMRKGGLSLRETAAKYNIPEHGTIRKWERIYLEEGPEALHVDRRGRPSATQKGHVSKPDKQLEEDLIAENQRLRAENDYLKKLNALVREREQRERKPR